MGTALGWSIELTSAAAFPFSTIFEAWPGAGGAHKGNVNLLLKLDLLHGECPL